MNATATPYLSKDEVSEKLQSIHYTFQESYWDSFVESQGTVKYTAPKPPAVKISPKLLAIPIGVVAVVLIVYFSINNMKSQNADSAGTNKDLHEAAMLPVSDESEKNTAPIKSTSPEIKPSATAVKEENTKPALIEPKKAEIKKEEKINTPLPVAKVVKQDKPVITQATTTSQPQENNIVTPAKKKRKQEKTAAGNELVPNPEDDNIVVPEN